MFRSNILLLCTSLSIVTQHLILTNKDKTPHELSYFFLKHTNSYHIIHPCGGSILPLDDRASPLYLVPTNYYNDNWIVIMTRVELWARTHMNMATLLFKHIINTFTLDSGICSTTELSGENLHIIWVRYSTHAQPLSIYVANPHYFILKVFPFALNILPCWDAGPLFHILGEIWSR